jgi:AcrR family transcriptional regulator
MAPHPPPTPAAARPRRSHAERSAHTRGQLLEAAARLVHEGGAQAASMFEVAKAAGVTPGAVQHHFGSKAELMLNLVEHLLQAEDGVAWPDPAWPLRRRAQALVQSLWDTVYVAPRFLAAWSVYFASSGDAALMQRVAERRRTVNAALRRRLLGAFPELAGRRSGDVGDLIFATLRGLALLRLFDPDPGAGTGARRELARWIEWRCQPPSSADKDDR